MHFYRKNPPIYYKYYLERHLLITESLRVRKTPPLIFP